MASADTSRDVLTERYRAVRATTEALAEPLSPEDQTVQSMPDVSPTKWHRAHTSWFFETFLLAPDLEGYVPFHPAYGYLFNSYYEAVGARHPRPERGLLSRPGVTEIAAYRAHVDRAMAVLLGSPLGDEATALVDLGIHHEQQHEELLLMDIKHVLSMNPLLPAYSPVAAPSSGDPEPGKPGWLDHPGGLVELGHTGAGFGFDNEFPRHLTHLTPFALADRPVTCGEWLAFMDDGGYHRPELWLYDGWTLAQAEGWEAPLYWSSVDDVGPGDGWRVFTLGGDRALDPALPVCHVSYYEADAYAHWTGARLPVEAEWEAVAMTRPVEGNLLDGDQLAGAPLHPRATTDDEAFYGDVWEWTASAYAPYPGFRAAPGAVGEYNGKFMVNQYVLRGGCCATPADHVRSTYRNFFAPSARWAFSGLRLARDL
ncbi:MAG TPA: ergothioneine biosynthesis protein EgtB [Acidimicrobiales bacterium]|nr:ergothioneine biosynthesis protein EgtB [Acidimicrobiales bacterium]